MDLPDYVHSVSFRLAHPDVPGSAAVRLALNLLRRTGLPLDAFNTRLPGDNGHTRRRLHGVKLARARTGRSRRERSSIGSSLDWPTEKRLSRSAWATAIRSWLLSAAIRTKSVWPSMIRRLGSAAEFASRFESLRPEESRLALGTVSRLLRPAAEKRNRLLHRAGRE